MVITVTLNPALDKIIIVKKLQKNHNNRSEKILYDIGGKATHVSVVLSKMGIGNVATGIFAGQNGRHVQRLLEEKGVKCNCVWQEGAETRESYIILSEEQPGSYMITQPGFDVREETFRALKVKLDSLINVNDIVVFSGTPPQVDLELYSDLLKIVGTKGGKLVVDTSRQYLNEALKVKPYLIKPNEVEFKELMAIEDGEPKLYAEKITELVNLGVEIVALSLGKYGNLIGTKEAVFRVFPPEIKEVNDTGCGDVFLGGALAMLVQGKGLEESFKFATAISASKATKEGSSDFSLEEAYSFLPDIKVYNA
ncbi:6-phosphofructokinase isozyme 2 [Peptococcaceae bacterium CEB3]|nr:6-phosphofructokinase isozyme 2 [Peptococcaceae bacterium CEB3]